MAEGMLGGVLGNEDEKPELETPDALVGAEAFAATVAARLSASDPEVARKTVEFLGKQSQLLETQNKHLKDENAARLRDLRSRSCASRQGATWSNRGSLVPIHPKWTDKIAGRPDLQRRLATEISL